jgi:phosphopantetheinyl transferase
MIAPHYGIDVFCIPLSDWLPYGNALTSCLSPTDFSDSKQSVSDQRKFVRALLRMIVGVYTHQEPEEVCLEKDASGKLTVAASPIMPLQVTVSHTDDRALIAVSGYARIGVDIERVVSRRNMGEVAKRVFSDAQNELLTSYHPAKRRRQFYTFWCRKEANAKVFGSGFMSMLQKETTDSKTHYFEIVQPPGYVACVASDHAIHKVDMYAIKPLNNDVRMMYDIERIECEGSHAYEKN